MTSKHSPLSDEEFRQFVPPKRTTHFIEWFQQQSGLSPQQINILDWGCGRGRETLWFRERGFNAFGVDVDLEPVSNGLPLFVRLGHPESALQVMGRDGRTPFADDFFHITYSNQVFEHVSDLDAVARELARITRRGGFGYHVYPAHKYLVEGHLFMPLVHWLPKNVMRRLAITGYTMIGVEPRWPELAHMSRKEKAAKYYEYSIGRTFYRRPAVIRQVFEQHGFRADFATIDHPRVRKHPVLSRLIAFRGTRGIVNYMLVNFVSNELRVEKG